MNPLPPQAYTKETLLKAYQWVQSQSPPIRELATTPDLLVSLYLKASRDGDQSLDRPSIHNFKSELRSLAGMMGELEKPGVQPSTGSPPLPPVVERPAPTGSARTTVAASTTPTPDVSIGGLDAKSLEMLREIKEQFNLSSEHEALRMLVKIGYQKAKSWMRED